MVGDNISNLINGLKIASGAEKKSVVFPSSKMTVSILETLKKGGLINDFSVSGDKKKTVSVELKYEDGEPKINGVKRISKYSKRVYGKNKDLRPVKSGYGISVVSTSNGIMTGGEAKKQKMGGEVLFLIW